MLLQTCWEAFRIKAVFPAVPLLAKEPLTSANYRKTPSSLRCCMVVGLEQTTAWWRSSSVKLKLWHPYSDRGLEDHIRS